MARPTFPVLTDDDGTGLTGTIINNAKFNEIKNYITKGLELKNLTELTIAAGVITITECFHTVDTEADDPSDDLDTINGGTIGAILVIKPVNGARTVIVKHNTGNIWLKGQTDITLDDLEDGLILIYTAGSKWIDLGAPAPVGGADPEEVRLPTPEAGDYATPSGATASSEESTISQTLQNSYLRLFNGGNTRGGQKITLTGGTLQYVRFYLKKTGAPTGTLYVRVRRTSDDGIIETSATTLDVTTITTDYAWYEFALTCAPDEEVRIIAEFEGGSSSNEVYLGKYLADVCPGVYTSYYGSWSDDSNAEATIIIAGAPTNPASDAIDDNTATYWTPDPPDEAGAWIKFDLGSLKFIGGCRIYWGSEAAYRPTEYKIYTSPDDSTWTEVIHETEAAPASAWKEYNWYVKYARYIKMVVTTHGASGTKVYEADGYSKSTEHAVASHGHGGL